MKAGILGSVSLAGALKFLLGRRQSPDGTNLPRSVSLDSFQRVVLPGTFRLRYEWAVNWSERVVDLDVSVERYLSAKEASRSIAETFDAAMESALATEVAGTLAAGLDHEGIDKTADRVAAVAEFVREVEYVTDRQATGQTEYPKYLVETLVENEGDCEDLAMVMAGAYASEPFDLDPVLLILPGHVGIGLDPDAFGQEVTATVSAGDRPFVYVDSTHPVDLGVVPEQLRSSEVIATYDGGWTLHDPEAFAEHVRESMFDGGLTAPWKYL